MMGDGSTATSKRSRRRRKTSTSMAMDDDDDDDDQQGSRHHEQNPPAPAPAEAAGAQPWTEEMHSSFLHGLEAAFVHDILFGWPGHGAATSHRPQQRQQLATRPAAPTAAPGLDRYVPDSAESTRDGRADHALPPAPALPSAPRVGGSRVRNTVRRNKCAAGDNSEQQSRSRQFLTIGVTAATSNSRQHPLPEPPKERDDGGGNQVVPLFEMPETSNASRGRRSKDLSPPRQFDMVPPSSQAKVN